MSVNETRIALAMEVGFVGKAAGPRRREALARFHDEWLQGVWAAATQGRSEEGIALAVVGGIARRDAGPLGDLDLVLVHADRGCRPERIAELADHIFYPLWDSGVRVDHSVRSVSQCALVAGGDLAVTVGLLDLVPVAGDRALVEAVRARVGADWRAAARKRLPEVNDAVRERHRRYPDLAQSLEPELKEARGGLRDMTTLSAVTRSWLADRPHGGVDAAYETLLDVRDALQVTSGRARTQLRRDDLATVAELLGLHDTDQLLTEISLAGRAIAHATDVTLRRAGQAQRSRLLRTGPRRPRLTALGGGAALSDGEVVLSQPEAARRPESAFQVAAAAARARCPIAPSTAANLAGYRPRSGQMWPPEVLAAFLDLLGAGPGVPEVWEELDQAGIIERWIPEWAAVRSRPQRSGVHRHTVDRHLLETVVCAQDLRDEVGRADLLLLGALFHDIGKVPGSSDHSVTGAHIAAGIGERIGLSAADRSVLTLLVREHLTLVDAATQRDPDDAETLAWLTERLGPDPEVCRLLRALTQADAQSLGAGAWTPWRSALVDQLLRRLGQPAPAPTGGDTSPSS